jgi:hypothetical protein
MIRVKPTAWSLLWTAALLVGCGPHEQSPQQYSSDSIELALTSTGWSILSKQLHRRAESGIIEVVIPKGLDETLLELRKRGPKGATESGVDLEKGEHAWEFVHDGTTITLMGKQESANQTRVYVELDKENS